MTRSRSLRTGAIATVAFATVAVLGACSAPVADPTDSPEALEYPAELTTVKVALQPPSSLAFLHLGVEQGFFEERNLELEFVDIASSDVGVTSLLSNDVQFATTNPPVQVNATAQGLPVAWVAVALTGPEELVDDNVGLFVEPDSGIETWTDLEGKRVQVPCINCISDLWVRAAVQQDGGDPDAVEFVVLPTADALPALEQGNVDGIQMVSQFLPLAEAAGYVSIGDHMLETALGQPVLAFSVNTTWADQHKDVVQAFRDAAAESATYAEENIDEWRAILPTYYPQQVPNAEAAAKVNAHWSPYFHRDAIQTILDYMIEWEWIDDLEVDDLFYQGVATDIR